MKLCNQRSRNLENSILYDEKAFIQNLSISNKLLLNGKSNYWKAIAFNVINKKKEKEVRMKSPVKKYNREFSLFSVGSPDFKSKSISLNKNTSLDRFKIIQDRMTHFNSKNLSRIRSKKKYNSLEHKHDLILKIKDFKKIKRGKSCHCKRCGHHPEKLKLTYYLEIPSKINNIRGFVDKKHRSNSQINEVHFPHTPVSVSEISKKKKRFSIDMGKLNHEKLVNKTLSFDVEKLKISRSFTNLFISQKSKVIKEKPKEKTEKPVIKRSTRLSSMLLNDSKYSEKKNSIDNKANNESNEDEVINYALKRNKKLEFILRKAFRKPSSRETSKLPRIYNSYF